MRFFPLAHLRLGAATLVIISLTACAPKKNVLYRPSPVEMVWYQQDVQDTKTRLALDACASIAADQGSIGRCMKSRGYLLIPRTEAELLRVRELQQEGFNANQISQRLQWQQEKVLRYMDENYQLPQAATLDRQPVELLALAGKAAVKPLIYSLKDHDPFVRRNAAEALGMIKDSRAAEPLIVTLTDPDPLVRRQAVQALGKIKDPQAVNPLISTLNNKEEASHVRMSATEALGQLGDVRAVEPLLAALHDQDWLVRSRSAEALGNIGDLRAVEPLIDSLKDEDATVRGYAAAALGEMRDRRAVEPLLAALDEEDKTHVRRKIEGALTKIMGR